MEKLISDTLAALPPEEQNGPLAALLPALFSGNQKKALDASYELWVLLCNQGQVIPAALPVYDLLVRGLQTLEPKLQDEVLDILYQFAAGTTGNVPKEPWRAALREKFQRDRAVYQHLAATGDEDAAAFARLILEQL